MRAGRISLPNWRCCSRPCLDCRRSSNPAPNAAQRSRRWLPCCAERRSCRGGRLLLLEGLTVIGAAESLPLVIQAYAEAPYSLARSRALTALRPHANHEVVSELLVESLWDCEPEAREIACGAVPLTDLTAVRRLKALGADVFEDAEVRRAAAGRGLRVSD